MDKKTFHKLLRDKVVILDGATGTELTKRGLPQGVCPEQWVLDHPEAVLDLQRSYSEAGSDIVFTPTFGGNRCKLAEFGLADKLVEINRSIAELSRKAAANSLIFGDLAPTGQFIRPLGELEFEEVVDIFKEQAQALLSGGVDGFVIETMMDLQETRAALLAVREICNLPVMISMTFGAEKRTLTGTDPLTALLSLQALGADAFGCNCSTGPQDMLEIIKQLKPYAAIPLLAKPNAGIPRLENGKTVFSMGAQEFAKFAPLFLEYGINIIGGCCGTTPEHIRQLSEKISTASPALIGQARPCAVTSSRHTVLLNSQAPCVIIGNMLNPSADPKLKKELNNGVITRLRKLAAEQTDAAADIIMLKTDSQESTETVAGTAEAPGTILPLMFDFHNNSVPEKMIRQYPGTALIRLNKGTPEKTDSQLLEIGKKYGTLFLLTPNYPKNSSRNFPAFTEAIQQTVTGLTAANIGIEQIIIQCPNLTPASATDSDNANLILQLIEFCHTQLGCAVLCDFSNHYDPEPAAEYRLSSFLAMAIDKGLNAIITNPDRELASTAIFAANALTGRDHKMVRYVSKFTANSNNNSTENLSPGEQVAHCVIRGEEENIATAVRQALDKKIAPKTLVDEHLIPAINHVGELFDKKEYFLPQLITSADAMRKAFDILEPLLLQAESGEEQPQKEKVILATVKGDIHDIGKNIVAIMLKNYNFEVIDLGKDVNPDLILDKARSEKVRLIGLSALMTTTMTEMKTVINKSKEAGLDNLKFMIGGAVVDQNYADEIGAHGYAADAMAAVRLARKLTT